ncbi:MAG: hypothetical protein JXR69_07425 [Candidatus Delongbacteria bacterium]|nr:hypothetical protein [Candidatus Delongbacteria bacterium]
MKYKIILIIVLNLFLSARELQSLNLFNKEFYFFDGFENNLQIYTDNGKLIKEVDMSNINKNSISDFFIRYNSINSYLFDSISGVLYFLDENYNLSYSFDLTEIFKLKLNAEIYPANYNSLILASEDLEKYYILENKEMSEIIFLSDDPVDYSYSSNSLFILFSDKVEVYSYEGIYQRSFPLKELIEPSKIFISGKNLFVKHKDGIDRINCSINFKITGEDYQTRIINESNIQDFAIVSNNAALLINNKIIFRTLE